MNTIRKKNIQNAVWPISLAERRRAMDAFIGCHSYLRAEKRQFLAAYLNTVSTNLILTAEKLNKASGPRLTANWNSSERYAARSHLALCERNIKIMA